jgi:hypothetical protein
VEELAPGIIQYDFSDIVAKNITKQAQDTQEWIKSGVMNIEGEQSIRTSYEMSFTGSYDSISVRFVNDYINICLTDYVSRYKFCHITQNESVGILKYTPGGWYDTHVDSSWQTYRLASLLVYINPQDYEGGETWFPNQNLKVKPEKPSVVFFPANYMYEHQAMPVKSGEKFVLVSWMSDLPQQFHARSFDYIHRSLRHY